MLSSLTSLPAIRLGEERKFLSKSDEIIYLGWVMASSIKGYKKARKRYTVRAIGAICLGPCGSQLEEISKTENLSADIALFTVQGGMKRDELRGFNRFMINMLVKILQKNESRTEGEDAMLNMILEGGDFVSEEKIEPLAVWYHGFSSAL
jgi:hypothetical protein